MDIIYGWVKNIVCFYIFMTMILHLLPRENYRKYVRFFSGMLLMILVANPVLSLVGKEDLLLQKINQTGFFQELDNLKLDTEHLEQTQKKVYIQEYEKVIEMDVSRMAAQKQLNTLQAEVHLSEEYQVESIGMEVELDREEGFSGENMFFSEGNGEYPEVQEFRQELMEFYHLQETQIEITVQGG